MQLQHIVLMCNVQQWMEMDILCRGAPGKLWQGEVWLMGSVQIYRGHIHPNLASRVTCLMLWFGKVHRQFSAWSV